MPEQLYIFKSEPCCSIKFINVYYRSRTSCRIETKFGHFSYGDKSCRIKKR